jgi:hypothetical protein
MKKPRQDPMDWGIVGNAGVAFLAAMNEVRMDLLEDLHAQISEEGEPDTRVIIRLTKSLAARQEKYREFLVEHRAKAGDIERNSPEMDAWVQETNQETAHFLAEAGALLALTVYVFCHYVGEEFTIKGDEADGILVTGDVVAEDA